MNIKLSLSLINIYLYIYDDNFNSINIQGIKF